MNSVVCRIAPEALLGFQMRNDTITLVPVRAARGGSVEARLATYEEVSRSGVTGAEVAGASGQPRIIGAHPVVKRGAGGGDKRRDKQNAQSHCAVVALGAPHTALPCSLPNHSRAVLPPHRLISPARDVLH